MQAQHFKFINCLERLTLENRHNEWFNCFHMTGLGTMPIDCSKSGNGKSVSSFTFFFSYLNFIDFYTEIFSELETYFHSSQSILIQLGK